MIAAATVVPSFTEILMLFIVSAINVPGKLSTVYKVRVESQAFGLIFRLQ